MELDYGLPGSAAESAEPVERLLVVCQEPARTALLAACGLHQEGAAGDHQGLGSADAVLCVSVAGAALQSLFLDSLVSRSRWQIYVCV